MIAITGNSRWSASGRSVMKINGVEIADVRNLNVRNKALYYGDEYVACYSLDTLIPLGRGRLMWDEGGEFRYARIPKTWPAQIEHAMRAAYASHVG